MFSPLVGRGPLLDIRFAPLRPGTWRALRDNRNRTFALARMLPHTARYQEDTNTGYRSLRSLIGSDPQNIVRCLRLASRYGSTNE